MVVLEVVFETQTRLLMYILYSAHHTRYATKFSHTHMESYNDCCIYTHRGKFSFWIKFEVISNIFIEYCEYCCWENLCFPWSVAKTIFETCYVHVHHTVLESRCFTFRTTCYTKLVEHECCIVVFHGRIFSVLFFFYSLLLDYAWKSSLTFAKTKQLLMRSLFYLSYGSV